MNNKSIQKYVMRITYCIFHTPLTYECIYKVLKELNFLSYKKRILINLQHICILHKFALCLTYIFSFIFHLKTRY